MSTERIYLLSFLLAVSSSRVLSTDGICSRIKTYTVTSMERYTEPVTVDTFTWCLQIPPRCLKTRTVMRERYRLKTEPRTKTVSRCCEGYQRIPSGGEENGIKCMPLCEKCFVGVCVSPNKCQCSPGFIGEVCATMCQAGTWGPQCKEKCDCGEGIACDPTNGHCPCPRGLRGLSCNETCPVGRWGPKCLFPCLCDNADNRCEPETGRCAKITSGNVYETFTTDESANATSIEDEGRSTAPETTETPTEATAASTPDHLKTRAQPTEDGNSSTTGPVIVLVSVPEWRRKLEKDRDKFALKNPFLRHAEDSNHMHEMPSSKTDYVKNIHKDAMHLLSIPLDIALIVVASIIFLGLTSVAVVMVLHMRSKLFESARLSIYEVEKTRNRENTGTIDKRNTSIVTSTLSQSPVTVSPAYLATTPDAGTILTIPNLDPASIYANGAATIGLRISDSLRDFLQDDHYDRPPSTRVRLQTFSCDPTTEHIYDEIPLQSSPMCSRKST
nr:uncharacterized protein LOC116424056 [Nomia melanderi]